MPDNITPASERTVVVSPNRLGLLTIVSLCFNALILLLLLIGVVMHHRGPKPPGPGPGQEFGPGGNWDRGEGGYGGQGGPGGFHHHEFGEKQHGWRRDGGFGRRGDDQCGGGRGGWGRDKDRGWGRDDGRDRDGGPGEMRMMRPPTATELTDHIMHHLTDVLALTDQENSQIRPVIEQQVDDLQKDMQTEQQARIKSIDDTTAKIRPMLTPDQQKQLDQMKTDEEQKMNPPGQEQPAPADQAKPKGT